AATISASLTFCLAFFTLPRLGRRPVVYSFKLREYTQHFFTDVKKSFKRPLVAKLMLLLFIGTFASMGSQAVFALWCESQLGWGAQQYGYLIIFYGLGIAIIQISAAGQLIHWLGDVRILLLGLITAAIGFLLIPFATTIPQLVGTLLFLMFSSATSNPVIASLFSQLSGAKQQGKTLGLMQSVIGLASFLGAIWAGFMFGFLGVNWPYWFSSVLVGISILFSWRQISQSRFSQIKQRQRRQKQLYLFELLDQNHDGSISLDDFQQVSKMFTHLRGEVSETNEYEILRASFIGLGELLIQIADQDGNLQVDQDEWLYFLEYQVEYDFATLFLQIIDENQDGRLTVEELRTFYRAYGIDIEELEEAFHTLDLTQSGYVSDDEFRAFFNQFLYGDDLQAPGNWLFGISLPQRL
ncbi:MAG: MFS transporter, partial [Cyanobacteria bacterium P01_F01_bin.116]